MRRNRQNLHRSIEDLDFFTTKTDSPERRLLCAILQAAVHSALNPQIDKPPVLHSTKRAKWLRLIKLYEESDLSLYAFAKSQGINPQAFKSAYCHRKKLAQLKFDEDHMTGYCYIMTDPRDASDAFSFEWICHELWDDEAYAIKTNIRKFILNNAKNLT